jgi:hypothetical protein
MSARPAIFGLFIAVLTSTLAFAQDAKLIEAAKKESGKIIAYGSLESNTVEPIVEGDDCSRPPTQYRFRNLANGRA